MKSKLLIITLSLVLAGCVSRAEWVPTQYSKISLEQAQNECTFEAEKSAPMMDMSKSVFTQGAAQNDIFSKCMKAKGFRLEEITNTSTGHKRDV